MADSAWFNDTNYYNTAQGWALEPDGAWRPVNPYRLLDFRSRLLERRRRITGQLASAGLRLPID